MKDIRVLIVGDDGVGKTSLIAALVNPTFNSPLQHVLPEIIVPPEWSREKASTHIVDSSFRLENREQLEAEIRKADVICIVYAMNLHDTFVRISSFWLPYIRKLGRNVPIIIVGNKSDIKPRETSYTLEELVLPVMNEFKEVETCIECSAKLAANVSEVFYFAQKTVLHPAAPLYDSREHVLKPACIDALCRIFKLADFDRNGVLDDEELNDFQVKCFGLPLQRYELQRIKDLIKEHDPSGFKDGGITKDGAYIIAGMLLRAYLEGFLYLQRLFIQRGRLETTWTVLRTYGYGNDLTLRDDFLHPDFDVAPDCSVELSGEGCQFFIDLFQSFDKDKDGALSMVEMLELFDTSPGIPWSETYPSLANEFGNLTLQGFLALWSMMTLLDYKKTLAYLAYLGYPRPTPTALKVNRPRKVDLRSGSLQRNVFLGYVFGATGSGKSSLLQGLLKKSFSDTYAPSTKTFSAVNSIELNGSDKYLVLKEFPVRADIETLKNKKEMDICDIVCFVYDSSDPNSFAYVANLYKQIPAIDRPVLFISTKSDLDLVPQKYDIQPDVFCRNNDLRVPLSVSSKEQHNDIYQFITQAAMEPHRVMSKKGYQISVNKWTAIASVTILVASIAIGIKLLHK